MRSPQHAAKSRLHGRCRPDAGAGHRSEHGALFRGERGAAQSAALLATRRAVAVYGRDATFTATSISYPNFLDWVRDSRSFSSLAAYRADEFNLTGMGEAEHVPAEMISASFFPCLA